MTLNWNHRARRGKGWASNKKIKKSRSWHDWHSGLSQQIVRCVVHHEFIPEGLPVNAAFYSNILKSSRASYVTKFNSGQWMDPSSLQRTCTFSSDFVIFLHRIPSHPLIVFLTYLILPLATFFCPWEDSTGKKWKQ